jgi:hypothetical protein
LVNLTNPTTMKVIELEEDNFLYNAELIVDSRHGQYCPQVFAEVVEHERFPTVSGGAWKVLLEGPSNDEYWDVWVTEVEGKFSDDGGYIYQDGDIWIVY